MTIRGTRKVLRFTVRLLFAILSVPILSLAANHYVRAGATGNGSGSDWTNAYTDLPSSLVRGDTYYVAAGSYLGIHTLKDPLSGTAVITIKKATVADHGTDTGWSDSYAGQAQFGQFFIQSGYYTIDGNGRTSPTSGYGIFIQLPGTSCTTNGCYAFWLQGGYEISHVTIRYVEVRGYGYDDTTSSSTSTAIYGAPGNPRTGGSISNISIQYCYFHDWGRAGCPILSRQWTNVTLEYSYFAVTHYFADKHTAAWSDGGTNNLTIRYNTFLNIASTGVIDIVNGGTPYTQSGLYIYGNVFWMSNSSEYQTGDGAIDCINNNKCSDAYIYNNTFVNFNNISGRIAWGNADPSSTNIYVYDNLWYNSAAVAPTGPVTTDYNYYIKCTGLPSESHMETGSSNPFVNLTGGDFHLTGATKAGQTLASPYDHDPEGNIRGADGTWDRGAYEFLENVTKPTPPSGLTVTGVS